MNPRSTGNDGALGQLLQEDLAAFLGFARRRLGDEHLAADAVQESLLRALRAEAGLAHGENLRAWFYRVLRNVLTDLHRRESARRRAMDRFALEPGPDDDEVLEDTACRCFRALLPQLGPGFREVLTLADLEGVPAAEAAAALGISRNLFKVRLHRARHQLRERLEQSCRTCASHGCLDCNCQPEA